MVTGQTNNSLSEIKDLDNEKCYDLRQKLLAIDQTTANQSVSADSCINQRNKLQLIAEIGK